MALDPSIYAQVGKPNVELESPQNALMRNAQLQHMQNQNKLAGLQLQDASDERTSRNALASAYQSAVGADGQIDRTKLYTGIAQSGQGAKLPGIQKQLTEADTAQLTAHKAKIDQGLQELEIATRIGGSIKDQNSLDAARALVTQQFGPEAAAKMPTTYDPAVIARNLQLAMSTKDQLAQKQLEIENKLKADKFAYDKTNDAANRGVTLRGQTLADARGKEANDIKRGEVAGGGKPPPGYRWKGDVLEAIPGGPGDKLPEAQQKQVVGTQNLSNAITEYRKDLKDFGAFDSLKPDKRASMGTKYNNMMLQAKEAYNLGVLNGPDFEILQSVITDPRSFTGAITSKGALDKQATELDRIMGGIASTSGNRRPQDGAPKVAGSKGKPSLDDIFK